MQGLRIMENDRGERRYQPIDARGNGLWTGPYGRQWSRQPVGTETPRLFRSAKRAARVVARRNRRIAKTAWKEVGRQ